MKKCPSGVCSLTFIDSVQKQIVNVSIFTLNTLIAGHSQSFIRVTGELGMGVTLDKSRDSTIVEGVSVKSVTEGGAAERAESASGIGLRPGESFFLWVFSFHVCPLKSQ